MGKKTNRRNQKRNREIKLKMIECLIEKILCIKELLLKSDEVRNQRTIIPKVLSRKNTPRPSKKIPPSIWDFLYLFIPFDPPEDKINTQNHQYQGPETVPADEIEPFVKNKENPKPYQDNPE